MKSGDVGRCVIVLISDGRANVPLAVSIGEEPEVAELPPGTEKLKLTDAEKKEQRAALKDEVNVCVCVWSVCVYICVKGKKRGIEGERKYESMREWHSVMCLSL